MRVAFPIFGGDGWTGGINYLRNLLSALSELPGRPVEAMLFHAPQADPRSIEALMPYLAQPPVVVEGWRQSFAQRTKRLVGSAVLQRDIVSESVFRAAKIDVVFQHSAWYGLAFPIPTLAWIADFQHRHLPGMFGKSSILKRDLGYFALSRCATRILVSSQDAAADCERFLPRARGRISVLPFCVQLPEQPMQVDSSQVRQKYALPQKYFYLPNQLWRHKNHLALIEGLRAAVLARQDVVVVASGNPKDVRNPGHPQVVFDLVKRHGLESHFRFLGMIPYGDIMPLMRGSVAVINPSLFEGWSTTVEEAKAMGVPLLLSNLRVHKEQAPKVARFFNPHDPMSIAECLTAEWNMPAGDLRAEVESAAMATYRFKRTEFAQRFYDIIRLTADQ